MIPLKRQPIPLNHACTLAAAWLCLGLHVPAQSQALVLRSSPRLQETLSAQETSRGAVHVSGERLSARPDMDLVLEGQATLRRPGLVIEANRLEYDQTQDRIRAEGGVHINRQGNVFEGPRVELQVDRFNGHFESPQYRLPQGGHGDAQRLDFIDPERMAIQQARYTTCRVTPGPEWLPEWFLKAGTIRTDTVEQTGLAEGVQLHFKGVSTPTLPAISFGLSSERQSGLLAPIMGVDSINGIDVLQPYYWNIAPNRDATLTTRVMSKRGVAVAELPVRRLAEGPGAQRRDGHRPASGGRRGARPAGPPARLGQP